MDSTTLYTELLSNPEAWSLFEKAYIEKKKQQMQRNIYFLKQKGLGLLGVMLGVAMPMFLDGDITASFLFVPLGIFLFFTREKIVDIKE